MVQSYHVIGLNDCTLWVTSNCEMLNCKNLKIYLEKPIPTVPIYSDGPTYLKCTALCSMRHFLILKTNLVGETGHLRTVKTRLKRLLDLHIGCASMLSMPDDRLTTACRLPADFLTTA